MRLGLLITLGAAMLMTACNKETPASAHLRAMPVFHGVVVDPGTKSSLYCFSVKTKSGAEKRIWARRNEHVDGYKLLQFDKSSKSAVLLKDGVPHLSAMQRGTVYHPDMDEPLSREHAKLAMQDFISDYEERVRAEFPDYTPPKLAKKGDSFAGVSREGKVLIYYPPKLSTGNIPRGWVLNLTAEDWQALDERYAEVAAGKFFMDARKGNPAAGEKSDSGIELSAATSMFK